MAWIYLIIAGIFEVVWAIGIKYCDGLRINIPSLTVVISMAFSVLFLALAMKHISIGTAYAVWTGIGIVGVTTYGILVFQEPSSLLRLLFLGMILGGIIGLKITTK
jgi:quaternary ammonium compound-resistance protein SugE